MSKFTSGQWDLAPLTGEVRANGSRIVKVYVATVFTETRSSDEEIL